MTERERLLQHLVAMYQQGIVGVVATVVRVNGSHYRRAGVRMLLSSDGKRVGMISSGCVDLHGQAMEVMESGRPVVRRYDTTAHSDIMLGSGTGCQGVVDILMTPIDDGQTPPLHECLEQPVRRGQSVVLATVVGPNDLSNSSLRLGARLLLTAKGNSNGYLGNAELQKAVEHDAEKILGSDQISAHTYPCGKIGVEVLIEGLTPEKRLILFGAGEDALPIVRIASEVGFDITVIDQRRAYADALRLPGADAVLHTEDVLSTIQQINPDPKTAFVSVTHNYLLDLEIMRNLAPTQTIYVGVVGPRARADQLIAASGWPDAEQHRLYCPAGLDIGAKTPEGIALSVVAEVQAVLAARLGSHLRERSGPIHGPTT